MTYNISDLCEYAVNQGGKCISTIYTYNDSKYKFECKNGHVFTKTWTTLLRKNAVFCSICSGTKSSISSLQEFANKYEGKCLDKEYIKITTYYNWECSKGHKFKKTWANMKRYDKFCPECEKKISLKTLQDHAKNKGGKCLSNKYTSCTDKYLWQCSEGHEWDAMWINVGYSNGTWCPHCLRWSFEEIRNIAIKKGGDCIKCISGSGLGGRYLWECSDGHQWETKAQNIVHGNTWCLQCQKLTLEICQEEAEKRGGQCLSSVYINRRTEMKWLCKNGHIFTTTLGHIRNNNQWCRECDIDKRRNGIDVAKELAIQKEGECLSIEYVNLVTPLRWRCKEGHEWESTLTCMKLENNWCKQCHFNRRRDQAIERVYNWVHALGGTILTRKKDIPYGINSNIINITVQCNKSHIFTRTMYSLCIGAWCPKCRLKSESCARDIIEDIMKLSFIKTQTVFQPDHRLELDGYNSDLKLAFEYNGRQHYEYIPHFHRNGENDLTKQQKRDQLRRDLCKDRGITLIEIPCDYTYDNKDEMRDYILERLIETDYIRIIRLKC